MWTKRPDILYYIIDCYAGVDNLPGTTRKRRVFLWEDGPEIKMGNTEAFFHHLAKKFELVTATNSSQMLHVILRGLGEAVRIDGPHAPRGSIGTGTFKLPDPDEWIVGRTIPQTGEDNDTAVE